MLVVNCPHADLVWLHDINGDVEPSRHKLSAYLRGYNFGICSAAPLGASLLRIPSYKRKLTLVLSTTIISLHVIMRRIRYDVEPLCSSRNEHVIVYKTYSAFPVRERPRGHDPGHSHALGTNWERAIDT